MDIGETTQTAAGTRAQQAIQLDLADLHCKFEEIKERLGKLPLTEEEAHDLYAMEQEVGTFAGWIMRLRFAIRYDQSPEEMCKC